MTPKIKVSEIFSSILGESTRAGRPCTIVRLSGCNLRCAWCDTPYAWQGGEEMTIDDILARVEELGCRLVEVTGGEPLIQPAAGELLRDLCDAGFETLLETNGSQDISQVDQRVVRIVDFKCPSSGEANANRWGNVAQLTDADEVKFVIADRRDYEFARRAVAEKKLTARCPVIFSPVHGRLDPAPLAEWILANRLGVRLGLQLHKIVFPGRDRGV
ncbi:MAG: radical SAM protein [Planctomycetota bacterium]